MKNIISTLVILTFLSPNLVFAQSIPSPDPDKTPLSINSLPPMKLQPGEKEEWKINISGKNTTQLVSEMVATLYDASLDEFRVNQWDAKLWGGNNISLGWTSQNGFEKIEFYKSDFGLNKQFKYFLNIAPIFHKLNWFGYYYNYSHDAEDADAVAEGDDDNESQYQVSSALSDRDEPATQVITCLECRHVFTI